MPDLELLEILPNSTGQALANIDSSVIWMHGLGADGHDFESVVEELNMPNTRFILPHAPYRPVSFNNGYEMRAWYDIYGLGIDSQQDELGIRQMQSQIEALIEREISRGIAANRIVLAGFSQGGAIALHTAARYSQRLAGVLALSTYLPLKNKLPTEAHAANHGLPILMAHGTFDDIIPLSVCKVSADLLRQQGFALDWHEYAMGHSLCLEEIVDIKAFLNTLVKH